MSVYEVKTDSDNRPNNYPVSYSMTYTTTIKVGDYKSGGNEDLPAWVVLAFMLGALAFNFYFWGGYWL